jgi:hypothetical protein
VLQAMRDYIEKVEQNENQVFRRALTNIPLGDLEFAPDFIAELESVGVEVTAVDNPSPLS